jgi:hypothetical protein
VARLHADDRDRHDHAPESGVDEPSSHWRLIRRRYTAEQLAVLVLSANFLTGYDVRPMLIPLSCLATRFTSAFVLNTKPSSVGTVPNRFPNRLSAITAAFCITTPSFSTVM